MQQYLSSAPFLRWFFKSARSENIRVQTFAPELGYALILAATWYVWPVYNQVPMGYVLYLLWAYILLVFITLTIVNIKTMLIPDRLTFGLVPAVILYQLINAANRGDANILLSSALGGVVVGVLLYIVAAQSKGRAIGGGDIKLGFIAGLLLGLKFGLISLFIFSIIGVAIYFTVYVAKRSTKGHKSLGQMASGPIWLTSIVLSMLLHLSVS